MMSSRSQTGKFCSGQFFRDYFDWGSYLIARLNANGSFDASFNPGMGGNLPVRSIFLKTDGKILMGGSIFTAGRYTPTGLTRLNVDGSLDAAFDFGTIRGAFDNARIDSILPLPTGKVLISGLLTASAVVRKIISPV